MDKLISLKSFEKNNKKIQSHNFNVNFFKISCCFFGHHSSAPIASQFCLALAQVAFLALFWHTFDASKEIELD